MLNSKNHPYASMNLKYGHPVEFTNEQKTAQHQSQDSFPARVMASVLSSRVRQISAGIIVLGFLAVLNLCAFFAALRMGLVFYPPDEGPLASELNRGADFEVCLMISVGDDRDQPNSKAVPFSEMNRLFDPVIAEMKDRPPGTKLLLAADYTSRLRVVKLDEEVPSRTRPDFPREKWQPTIVTAFSGNHFPVASLLLRSLAKAGKEAADAGIYNISVVVYSIEEFNSTLQGLFDCVVREMNEVYHVKTEARVFNFSAVPEWMRLDPFKPYSGTGEYAWKVLIIHQVLLERGFVIWSDAGNRFTLHGLVETLSNTFAHGFSSRTTIGVLPNWVHPGMLKYFRYNFHHNPPVPNCDGSSVGVTLDRYETVVRPWYECSITRQCLAPDGSSRINHRQDQSALTIITSMNGVVCQGISSSVKRHMDDHPTDYFGTNPTACYIDPLQVVPPPGFYSNSTN
ncbi:hypothetical protein R1flu_023745 [Riccia fluitans]|uniref:Uncharacterized protein n=1 Tax=Riccia fluitans TaxID=41844 RepID=A0ABD1XSX0_9MARC